MTRKITPAQLDEIESRLDDADFHTVVHDSECVVHIADVTQGGADAEHIAMMDPATTLALVAEVRELRAKVERVREIIGDECRTRSGDWHPWPCPAIRALGEEA